MMNCYSVSCDSVSCDSVSCDSVSCDSVSCDSPHLYVDPADVTDAAAEGGEVVADGLEILVIFFKYLGARLRVSAH